MRKLILLLSILMWLPVQADDERLVYFEFEVSVPDSMVSEPRVALAGGDKARIKLGLADDRKLMVTIFAAHPDESGVEVMIDGDFGTEVEHYMVITRKLAWGVAEQMVFEDGAKPPVTVKLVASWIPEEEFMDQSN